MLNKSVKNFKQYDSRWGRMTYPKSPYYMSNAGCGATATADIIASNPKYKKRTPKTTRKWLMKHNYVSYGNGTYWNGISAVLKAYGFKVTNHATMTAFFKEMAKEGRAGVILFRKGTKGGVTWTSIGHFCAVKGYKKKNGQDYLYICDPGQRNHTGWYSYQKTMQGLVPQVWSCYLPEKATAKEPTKADNNTKNSTENSTTKTTLKGYDISYWQGKITKANFEKSLKAGWKFAILRIGYNRELKKDSVFENNYKNALAAGLKVGVYYYSTALNVEQAKAEANFVLKELKGRKLTYPVFIDFEDKSQASLGKDKSKKICEAFCAVIEKAGYPAGVYASYNFLTNKIGEINKKYYVWLAQYPKATYKGRYELHQYSSSTAIPGIASKVDADTSELKGGTYPKK